MTIFLDTSALLKRYVEEDGTRLVLELMDEDRDWVASALALAETEVTVCHLGFDAEVETIVRHRVRSDWERFLVVPIDATCLRVAADIGCDHHVRTLDAIHLAAASRIPGPPSFTTFDRGQARTAKAMGFPTPDGVA